MLQETEETISFFVTFLSLLVALQLGGQTLLATPMVEIKLLFKRESLRVGMKYPC